MIFDVCDEVGDLVPYDFGKVVTIEVGIEGSQILMVMALCNDVSLLSNAGRIR